MTVLLVSEARKLHLGSRFFNTVCAIVKSYHANVMHVNARNDKADILFYNKNFQYGLQAMCSAWEIKTRVCTKNRDFLTPLKRNKLSLKFNVFSLKNLHSAQFIGRTKKPNFLLSWQNPILSLILFDLWKGYSEKLFHDKFLKIGFDIKRSHFRIFRIARAQKNKVFFGYVF